jgi:hypothetical protein
MRSACYESKGTEVDIKPESAALKNQNEGNRIPES